MRILLVNNLFGARARGGAERIVAREALALTERGHDVTVLATSAFGGRVSTHGEIDVHEARPYNLCAYEQLGDHGAAYRLLWHGIDTFGPGVIRRTLRVARDVGADVVHTHNLMGVGFMLPRMLARSGVRHVHTVHDVQLLHPSGLLPVGYERPRTAAERTYVGVMRRVMGSPAAVAFPSDALRTLHERNGFFPRSEVRIVRNPSRAHGAHAPRTRPERTSFVFVGQLERHKGPMLLLKAWERWADKGDATLTMIGTGALEGDVRAAAKRLGNVHVLGKMDAKGVHEALASATYAVMPSRVIENAPAVVMEAFGEGTPVIASASGGIPELVLEGETGFLCRAESSDSLLEALRRAAKSASWTAMSGAAAETARMLSMDSHVDALEAMYRG